MAKKLRSEDLVLNVIVNGDQGRAEMQKLERQITDLGTANERLEQKQKKLEAAGKSGSRAWQENKAAIAANNEAIKIAQDRLEQLRKGLDLTSMSLRDLQREQGRLTQLMRNATPGTENFARYSAQLEKVKARITELNGKAKSTGLSLGKLADGLNRYVGVITAGFATFALLVTGARAAGNAYAQLDDKVADVMKTTGLAKEVVYDMNESLSKVNTRTAQLEMLGLAQQAGKLGISARRDVEDFVLAADKIGVALGEDLGDKEEAIRQIGKIVDLFQVKEEFGMGDGMLKVGSVINALGAASTANEGYIVDFTKRLGGIAVPAKMSVTQVAGLGATLDALGQASEASSTAVGKVITGMFRKTSEYAKVAGMDVKAFKQLMTEDINEAFIKVLEGMQGGGLDRVVAMLGDLGEKGARVTTSLGTLASNTQKLRKQQALANDEFVKGTSVLNEYETKNNSAQADLEKAQKSFQQRLVELGKSLQPLMAYTTTGFATVVKALTGVVKVFKEYKDIIVSAAIAVGAYVVVAKAYTLWTTRATTGTLLHTAALKARIIWEKATVAAMQLHLAMSALLTGSLKTARIAMLAFAKATLLSPAGIIIALTAIIYAVTKLGKSYDAAARSAKDMSDVTVKAGDSYMNEKVKLEQLLKIASDKTASDQARKKAIKELQAAIPNGIKLINEETIATGKAKKAVDDYCDSLMLQAKLEAAKEKLIEIEKERLKALENGERTNVSSWQFVKAIFTSNTLSDYVEENKREFDEMYDHRQSRMSAYIEDLYRELAAQKDTKNILGGDDNSNADDTDGGDDKAKDWALDNDEAFMGKKIALKRELWQGEIATEAEYNRLLLALEIEALQARLDANIESGEKRQKLQMELLDRQYQQAKNEKTRLQMLLEVSNEGKSNVDKENVAYEKRLRDLELFGKRREDLTREELAALVVLERQHTEKLSALYVDELSKEISGQQKAIQRKATALKQSHNDELATAKTFEQKKALLGKWFSAEELRRVKTDKEADRLLKAQYAAEEQAAMKEDLEQMLTIYQSVVKEVGETGFISEGVKATEDDIGKLLEIIAELEKKLAKYGGTPETTISETDREAKFDVLGMSSKKWEELFDNIQAGNFGLEETLQIVQAIGNAFGEVSKLMTAMEQRDLKAFTRSQDKRKKAIENRVKAGQMSEEQAASATQKIDEETDARKEELEIKQAKRQKQLAIFDAITSTAVAVVSALGSKPWGPWNIALAALVGSLGAVQIATILATPLPGAEAGGMFVERQQDGKRYRAGYDPDRRGPVDKPTVLVGENGTEYVVPAEGYENPTIRPVLDIMERARRAGTIREINLPAALAASGVIPGRASGGYVQSSGSGTPSASAPASSANAIDTELLRSTKAAVDKLNARLDSPILAQVAMAGDKGLARQFERYNKTVNASQL